MNLHNRIKSLERRTRGQAECQFCRGKPCPNLRVEFENGDEPLDLWRCRCGATGGAATGVYRMQSRELFDAV